MSTEKKSFTSSFPAFMVIISFSYFIALARTSSSIPDSCGVSTILFPSAMRKDLVLTSKYNISARFFGRCSLSS